jgi:hypothetical protein
MRIQNRTEVREQPLAGLQQEQGEIGVLQLHGLSLSQGSIPHARLTHSYVSD